MSLERITPAERLRALIGLWPALHDNVAPPAGATLPYSVTLVIDDQPFTIAADDKGLLAVTVGEARPTNETVQATAETLWPQLTGSAIDTAAETIGWLRALGGDDPIATLTTELASRGPAIGADCLGRSFTGDAVELSAEEMLAFAEATSDDNPRFAREAHEQGELIAPPLFPVRFFNPMFFQVFADPTVKMDFSRLLFGEMELSFHGVLRPGETIVPEAETLTLQDKETGQLLRVGVGLRVDGELRCSGVASFFVRWKHRTRIQRLKLPSQAQVLGHEGFASALPIRDDQAQLFAAAANDPNPLHLDDSFAKRAGLPGVILHGLCSMAFCGRAVLRGLCDDDPARLERLKVRFSKPARPGQTLTVRGFAPRCDDGHALHPFIAVTDAGDQVISGGEATLTE
jgi:acyl dehydratase